MCEMSLTKLEETRGDWLKSMRTFAVVLNLFVEFAQILEFKDCIPV